MTKLQTGRYNQVTPNLLLDNGVTIACPIYFNLPLDTCKALLNAFREVKLRQLVDMGYEDTRTACGGGITVKTAVTPPQTDIEIEIGMNEEALRYALFTRQGIQERLLLRLQKLLNIELVTRDEIEQCYSLWLDEFIEKPKAKKTTASRTKKAAV